MAARLRTIFAALTAIGCGRQSAAPVVTAEYSLQQAADSIPLHLREDVRVGEVWMTLTGVPSDSRCPRGVTCVWAGDAVAAIAVHPPCYKAGCKAASVGLELHTSLEPRAGVGWNYHVELRALHPAPVYGNPPDATAYVAWVRVTK